MCLVSTYYFKMGALSKIHVWLKILKKSRTQRLLITGLHLGCRLGSQLFFMPLRHYLDSRNCIPKKMLSLCKDFDSVLTKQNIERWRERDDCTRCIACLLILLHGEKEKRPKISG